MMPDLQKKDVVLEIKRLEELGFDKNFFSQEQLNVLFTEPGLLIVFAKTLSPDDFKEAFERSLPATVRIFQDCFSFETWKAVVSMLSKAGVFSNQILEHGLSETKKAIGKKMDKKIFDELGLIAKESKGNASYIFELGLPATINALGKRFDLDCLKQIRFLIRNAPCSEIFLYYSMPEIIEKFGKNFSKKVFKEIISEAGKIAKEKPPAPEIIFTSAILTTICYLKKNDLASFKKACALLVFASRNAGKNSREFFETSYSQAIDAIIRPFEFEGEGRGKRISLEGIKKILEELLLIAKNSGKSKALVLETTLPLAVTSIEKKFSIKDLVEIRKIFAELESSDFEKIQELLNTTGFASTKEMREAIKRELKK